MSWRAEADRYRAPLSVDHTAGGAGTIDASGALAASWDHFWANVQTTGNDVRITEADGITLVTFDLQAFNATTRVCTVEIDNFTPPGAGMLCLWAYWGDAALASGTPVFVPVAPKALHVDVGQPASPLVVVRTEQRPQDTTPLSVIAKTTDSSLYIWWDFSGILQRRLRQSQKSSELECISYVSGVTVALNGADQAGMKDVTKTRFEGGPDGRAYVKTYLTAGVNNTDYIATVTVVTTESRTLAGKAKIFVRDMS